MASRALQAENSDLEKVVLRFCIRPIDGAFELLAIMDIRALRSHSRLDAEGHGARANVIAIFTGRLWNVVRSL